MSSSRPRLPLLYVLHSGNLYGTANFGSANNDGTVFELTAGNSTLTTLATFNGANGQNPQGVIMDSHGDLFGSTMYGGDSNRGTVFGIVMTLVDYAPQIVLPFAADVAIYGADSARFNAGSRWLFTTGRLKPGVSLRQAEANIAMIEVDS